MRSSPAARVDAFVDAAFAFAVTLLLIGGGQPPVTLDELETVLLRVPASAAAFCLIAMFWLAHRSFGRLCAERSGPSLLLSLAIVFTVLAYVYPLRLLAQAAFFWISGGRLPGEGLIHSLGDLAALYQIYGLGFFVLSALYAALFARALRLAATPDRRAELLPFVDAWTICALSGLISAGVAFLPLARTPWLPPLTYWLIPVAIGGMMALRRRRADGATEIP